MVKFLLEHGANLAIPASPKYPPLRNAIYYDHVDVIKVLLENGADVNQPDVGNCTPLFHAVNRCDADVVELLLNNGADKTVNTASASEKMTPLHCAVEKRDVKKVKLLLQHKASTQQRNAKGEKAWDVVYRIIICATNKKVPKGIPTILRLLTNAMVCED